MAKKENLSSGRVDFDAGFNDFNFDFDAPPPKDNRSPITKVVVGALSGARSAAQSEQFIRKSIKAILPEDYGTAIDLQDEVSRKSKELYNNAVREVKPVIGELSSAADKLLPANAGKLKAKLKSINDWSKKTGSSYSYSSKEDNEKASIAASITETFRFQMEQQAKDSSRSESREILQESLALSRHRDSFDLLNRMNFGISRLAQYQDKVTSAYQKKSLELQYRSLFTSIDILQEAKRQNAFTSTALADITKNTALPDFVKLTASDRLEGALRNKLSSTIGKSILGGKDNPITVFSDHISKVFNEKIQDMVGVLSSSAQLLAGMGEKRDEYAGQDKYKSAGEFVGSKAVQYLGNTLGPRLKKYLPKKITDNGPRIAGAIKNSTQYATKLKDGNFGEKDGPIKAALFSFMKDFIPNFGVSKSLEKDSAAELNKPYIYTKQTHKTINEVIPGYLSRIFRELQVTRTGNSKIGLTLYDSKSNKFADSKSVTKNILDSIVSKEGIDSTKSQMDALGDLIDPGSKNLSPKARKAFLEKTLRDNLAGKLGTADRTAHEYTYLDDKSTKPYSKEIAKAMQAYFKSDKNGKIKNNSASYERQNAFTDKQRNLGRYMSDSRGEIQNLINLGNYDELEKLGLVDFKDGKAEINLEKLTDYYTGGKYTPQDDFVEGGAKGKKMSRAARPMKSSPGFMGRTQSASTQQVPQQSSNSELLRSSPEMGQVASTLGKIQEILLESNVAQEAYFTNLIDNVRAIGISTTSAANATTPEGSKNNGNIFQGASINLRNFLGKTTKTIGSLFTLGNKVGMSGMKMGGSILGTGIGIGKSALNIVGNALNRIGQKRELFMPGEEEPRIKTVLLRAGKYFNKKGKVFKSLDDINDTVYDEDGVIVITKEELKESYIRSKQGSGLFKIVKFGSNLVMDAAKLGTSLFGSSFKLGFDLVKSTLRMAKNLLDQPEDIYIKGSDIPVMLKRSMTGGGYFLKSDKSPVMRPSQITGTIINAEGDIVLTEEDLRTGIFDKNGKPIKSPLGRLLSYASSAIKLGARLGAKAIGYAARTGLKVLGAGLSAGKKALGIGGKFLTGGLGSFIGGQNKPGDLQTDNYQTLDVLERIFNVLDSRLPSKANRKGSWRDGDKRSGKASRAADGANAASKGGIGDGLLDKGKGILDLLGGNSVTVDGTKTTAPGGAQPKKGFFNKMKGFGGSLLGGKTGALLGTAALFGLGAATAGSEPGSIGSALSTAADVAGTASTIYNIGKFILPAAEVAGATLGGGALTTGGIVAAEAGTLAATTAGAAAVSTAAAGTGIGATILSGLGALATGVGAILGSPVVLGALALAAVGTAGYFAYQYFKKEEYLKNLRLVQYGFNDKNTSGRSKVLLLEDSLKDAIVFKEGTASIDDKKADQKKMLSLFGVNDDDTKAVNKWLYWFQNRFKPVFLTHLTALKSISDKTKLQDMDDLKPEEKDKLLELIAFNDGPYGIDVNPVAGSGTKLSTAKEVSACFKLARTGIDAEIKDKKKDANAGGGQTESVTQYDAMGNITGTVTVSKADDALKSGKDMAKDYSKDNSSLNANKGVQLAISSIAVEMPVSAVIDALEGIRMRSYGLTTMESDKVSSLRRLENLIIPKVQYGGDGKAIYKADSIDTIVAGGMFFGVTTGTDLANSWNKWFQTRFLPIYLAYLSLVKQNAGSPLKPGIVPSLTALQALSIGTQISAIDSTWLVTDSPWAQYKLGTDQSIVKELIESLRVNSKKVVMPEAVVAKPDDQKTTASNTDSQNNAVKSAIDNKGKTSTPPGGLDAESPESNRAPVGSPESLNGVSGLALAGGPLSDGRNYSAYLQLAQGATLDGLNPEFAKNFKGLIDEYGVTTGKSTLVNSGFRSYEKQAAFYKADPSKAAPPGTSLHESGLAVDVQSEILNDMDKRGLLRKYGFTRPVGGEPWHLEATGIQGDINAFKRDPNLASKAIAAGIGKGGGGYGTMADATKYKRNAGVAQQILNAAVSPSKEDKTTPAIPDKAQIAGTAQPNMISTPTFDALGNMTGSVDSEAPVPATAKTASLTKSQIYGSFSNGRNYGKSPTGNMMPALQDVVPSTGAKYESIPVSTGTGWIANKDMIVAASNAVGVDPKYMAAIGAIESGFDPAAANPNGNARGLNQFMPETWTGMMKSDGSKYGIPPGTTALDAKANAILGAAYVKQNISALSGVKSNITGTDVYMAHFLGAAGAKKFLSSDPNAIGAQALPKSVPGNESIFYDIKNGNRPRTISEIYSLLDNRMQTKLQALGVDSKYFPSISGLVAKNMSTNGLEIRTPSIGLNANAPTADSSTTSPTGLQTVGLNGSSASSSITGAISPMSEMGGFNMQGVQQLPQNPRQDMNTALGDVGTTLTKSLDIQTKMLDALQTIIKLNNTLLPSQQGAGKIQTSDDASKGTEAQQQQNQAINSYDILARKTNVPVPMNRV